MSFWDEVVKADSVIDTLDSQFPRQRWLIFQALESPLTCGEWLDVGFSVCLYGKNQGVICYIRSEDDPLRFLVDEFLASERNQKLLSILYRPTV